MKSHSKGSEVNKLGARVLIPQFIQLQNVRSVFSASSCSSLKMKYSRHLFIFCVIAHFPSGMLHRMPDMNRRANPCATSIGTLGLIPLPHELPSGTNVCHRSCYDQSRCSFNLADTFGGYPLLLFRCQCLGNCPPRKVLFGDYMSITCNNVTAGSQSSRCSCGASEDTFQCDFDVIEDPKDRPFYCACCSRNTS